MADSKETLEAASMPTSLILTKNTKSWPQTTNVFWLPTIGLFANTII